MNAAFSRAAFLRTVEQLHDERTAARPLIESVRANLASVWEQEIPGPWRTAGFVQELTSAAGALLETNPLESLQLAELALAVCASIPAGTYPAPIPEQLAGMAWKEIGTAQWYMSEYDAALRAYDAAKRSFQAANALGHDEAIVDLGRAIVLSNAGKQAEALAILTAVLPRFEEFGDERRLAQSALLMGVIAQRNGRLQEALVAYEQVVATLRGSEDLHTLAMAYNNLGDVYATLGRTNDAVAALQQARDLHKALEKPAEVTRTEWVLARTLLTTGEYASAIPMLVRAREHFLGRSMPEEAGLAGLDLAEAFLATGAMDDAIALVRAVLTDFERAKLNARAITALAYLRDLLPSKTSQSAIRHVRTYLEQLHQDPARVFLPQE